MLALFCNANRMQLDLGNKTASYVGIGILSVIDDTYSVTSILLNEDEVLLRKFIIFMDELALMFS
jgi:hypothetical protein